MRKPGRWLGVALLLLLGAATEELVRRNLPPPRYNLISRATKLADVENVVSYDWLSNDDLLVKTDTNYHANATPQFWTFPWMGYMDLIDPRTGTRTRLEGLTAALMQNNRRYNSTGPWSFQRSPDGQWLLWTRDDPADGGQYPVTARTDGSQYREWKTSPDASHSWLDGRRWATSIRAKDTFKIDKLIIHDAAERQVDRTLSSKSSEAQALLDPSGTALRSHSESPKTWLWASLADSRANDTTWAIFTQPADETKTLSRTRIDTISFPAGTRIIDNLPNLQADRIEFLVSETNIPPYAVLLHCIFPSYTYKTHPVQCLCVYSLDQKKLYELGRVNELADAGANICNAFWLSDGRRIAFYYQNAVYTVAVP